MLEKNICIIPARGGSKRLPKKNILNFHGKPIIQYTIEAAIDSGCFTKVIVSSDDPEILKIASDCGVVLHKRSKKLSNDQARVVDVCCNIISDEKAREHFYDCICVLYATAPMRTANDIKSVMSLLALPECNFAIAATHFSHYPFQALKVLTNNYAEPMWPDLATKKSNEVVGLIAGNGSTYAAKIGAFEKYKEFYGPGMRYHLMDRSKSIDIDTKEDWALAEILFNYINKGTK